MKCLELLAAGVFLLSTPAGANDWSASTSPLSPEDAAMSEAITQLLISRLGEDVLWTKLTGRPRQYNQRLYVDVPSHAVTLGQAAFDDKVRFQVKQQTQWVENCNGTQDLSQTIESTSDVVNSYYNTQMRNAQSTQSHTVTLDAKVGSSLGSYVETSYSFNRTDNASESGNTRNDSSNDNMVKETITLTAKPGESVAYQTNQVVLTGTQASFAAQASINTSALLDFYVQTVGTLMPDVGVAGPYITALNNSPVPGQQKAAQDLSLGQQVLRSPDGGYIFGMETGRGPGQHYGTWSVIDLNASQPGMPSRLWSPLAASNCPAPLDFVITGMGQMQMRCTGKVVWQSPNSASTGNPCYYLTFVPTAPGELVCYSAPPDNNGQITYLSGVVAVRNMGEQIKPGMHQVKKSLSELMPVQGATQNVSFTGSFDGSMGVLGPIHCLITYASKVNTRGDGCKLHGLTSSSSTSGTGNVMTKTPSGEFATLSWCGPTNAFLQPYITRNPMAVSGN